MDDEKRLLMGVKISAKYLSTVCKRLAKRPFVV